MPSKPNHLSAEARIILDTMINGKSYDWWEVVVDPNRQRSAIKELVSHRLIEMGDRPESFKVMPRGRLSNAKAREAKLL